MSYRLGFSVWLLTGALPERMSFLADQGFEVASLLQSVMEADPGERREAAAVIRERGLGLTYHGNVHGNLKDGRLDPDFVQRMFDDVFWWHENAAPVHSCCSDQITRRTETGERLYLWDDILRLMELEAEAFSGRGIGFGMENLFLPPGVPGSSLEPLERLHERFGAIPGAGMLFDTGHANIRPPCPIDEQLARLRFPLHEVHISDNFGECDDHLPPGMGRVDFSALRRGLEARNYSGVVTLEFCPAILKGMYAWNLDSPAERELIAGARRKILDLLPR